MNTRHMEASMGRHGAAVAFAAACSTIIGNAAWAIPIIVNDAYHYVENRSPNTAGFSAGVLDVFGASTVIPNGGAGTTGFATQGARTRTLFWAGGTTTLNEFSRNITFNPARTDAWTLNFANGPDTRTVRTPTITSASVLPFAQNVTISGSGLRPTFNWTIPIGAPVNAIRLQVLDLEQLRIGGSADFIHNVNLPPNVTSFTVPSVFSSGKTLETGHRYSFALSLFDTRDNTAVVPNRNILSRSRSFFDFVPAVDPIPNDPSTRPGPASLALVSVNSLMDLTKPTIVLTHGWQPTGSYNPAVTPLTELLNATKATLLCETGTCSANILSYQWEDAYQPLLNPWGPRFATQNMGTQLATNLKTLLGPDYSQNIHLVGHSFGTLVNSYAASALNNTFSGNKFAVDQLTFLDPPLRDLGGALRLSAGTYHDILPTGTVQYVDNYFGNLPFPLAFGAPIFGAAPNVLILNGGELVPFTTHGGVHSKFYADRILDKNGTWTTAVLAARYATRPEPKAWSSDGLLKTVIGVTTEFALNAWRSIANTAEEVKEYAFDVAGKVYRVVVDASNAVIKKSSEIATSAITVVGDTATAIIETASAIVSSTGRKVLSWLHLKESSPVMIGRELTVPVGTESLTFDFDFLNVGDGDWLTVHFGGELLWSFIGTDFLGDIMKATIALPEFAGQSGTLFITLNSTGDRNADVLIGNIAFSSYATNTSSSSVPEPPSVALLLIAFASLLVRRQRKLSLPRTRRG